MPLFVVAYPRFSRTDRGWIDRIRAVHDAAKHGVLPPHLTIVFGTAALDGAALASHVAAVARGFEPFEAFFPDLRAVRDALSSASHVMLVPHEGFDELVSLHARLYEGPLARELRADIPYVPHVTIAQCDDFSAAHRLFLEVSPGRPIFRGRIEELFILNVQGNAVVDSRSVALGTG
jgi:2'-5' RNA ligase